MSAPMIDVQVDAHGTSQPERHRHRQSEVNHYFENVSSFWQDIYENNTLEGRIYQRRKSATLSLLRELSLPHESDVLEIGSGSGHLTVDLARKYRRVTAIDAVNAMVNTTRQKVIQENLQHVVRVEQGDVHSLSNPENTFDLVVALGVLPWLHSPGLAVTEMTRVLKPGGNLVMSSDNRFRLNYLLDPRWLPALSFFRAGMRKLLEFLNVLTSRNTNPSAAMYSIRECDDFFSRNGLQKIKGVTVGFGPFGFVGTNVFPEELGIRIHEFLQEMSERQLPLIRSLGSHYLVVARKPIQ